MFVVKGSIYRIYVNLVHTIFEVFWVPKTVHVRIDGALDVRTKSETTILLSVKS